MDIDMELEFDRGDLDSYAMNRLHSQVQVLVETIRGNEGLETVVVRSDDAAAMRLGIGVSDHEQKRAILEGVADRAQMWERKLKRSMAASELLVLAREVVGARRVVTKGRWPSTTFVVGPFHYSVDHETVTVTKDTSSGIESVAVYDYSGKGRRERGQRRPTPEADWEHAEEMAWRMAQKQARA